MSLSWVLLIVQRSSCNNTNVAITLTSCWTARGFDSLSRSPARAALAAAHRGGAPPAPAPVPTSRPQAVAPSGRRQVHAPTSPAPDMAGDVSLPPTPPISMLAGASTGHRRWCRHGESGPAAEGCHPRLVDAEVNHGRGSDGCSQLGHPGPAQTSGVSTLRLQTVVSSANRVEGNAMRAQGCGRLLGGCFTC